MVWWLVLVCIPFFWLLQNVLHEGAHVVVGRMQGLKTDRFWPLPGWSHKDGKFRFAYVLYKPSLLGRKHDEIAERAIAPVITNSTAILLAPVLGIVFNDYMASVLFVFWLMNFFDGANNARKGLFVNFESYNYPEGDVRKWGHYSGFSIKQLKWYSGLWIGVAAGTGLLWLV